MIFTSGVLVLFLADGHLSRLEGFILFAGILAYTTFNIWKARREHAHAQAAFDGALPAQTGFYWRHGLFIVGGLALLVVGADLLVKGAVTIAEQAGLSKAVIGLTIIALGTSLPELATSLVAAYRQEGDIAIGNIIGSNVFNILAILGLASLAVPLDAGDVGMVDLAVMMAFAVLLLPLMRTGFRLCRWEGALLLLLYAGYVYYLLP
jgi:cation:H+ antiporter